MRKICPVDKKECTIPKFPFPCKICSRYILFVLDRTDPERKESQIFSSNNVDIREVAEQHWKYSEGIIKRGMLIENCREKFRILDICSLDDIWLELCHYLYVAAMIHGYKHCEDELKLHGYYNEKEIQE